MNKKGLEFKSGFFSIIAVSLLVIAFGVIISNQTDYYSSDAVSQLEGLNRLDNISDTTTGYRRAISPNDPDPSDNAESSTFRGVYGIITNIFTSFDLVLGNDGMLNQVVVSLGLPDYVRQGIVVIILTGIVFSLIAVIFRLTRRSA